MAETRKPEQPTRCRPGDMARIVHSRHRNLIGQLVLVEDWQEEHGRWRVCLMSGPAPCRSLSTGLPIVTAQFGFRDSSLEPLPRYNASADAKTRINLHPQEHLGQAG